MFQSNVLGVENMALQYCKGKKVLADRCTMTYASQHGNVRETKTVFRRGKNVFARKFRTVRKDVYVFIHFQSAKYIPLREAFEYS